MKYHVKLDWWGSELNYASEVLVSEEALLPEFKAAYEGGRCHFRLGDQGKGVFLFFEGKKDTIALSERLYGMNACIRQWATGFEGINIWLDHRKDTYYDGNYLIQLLKTLTLSPYDVPTSVALQERKVIDQLAIRRTKKKTADERPSDEIIVAEIPVNHQTVVVSGPPTAIVKTINLLMDSE